MKVEPYDWTEEHERLWDTLVPPQGQAPTVQGELVRIAGKLTDEAHRNGNRNWDRDCERLLAFIAATLDDPATFSPEERAEIRSRIDDIIRDHARPDLSGHGNAYYFITEKVVDWCLAHPELLPHQADPTLAR
jgi:hypothetical protein